MKHKSTTVSKRVDAREARTKRAINEAFVALLQRRAYDGIRVSDIARKSGVGRATFYAHYASKDALLRAQLDALLAARLEPLPQERCAVDATPFLLHVQAVPALYRLVMSSTGRRVVEVSVESYVQDLVARAPQVLPSATGKIVPVSRFLAASLIGLIGWWVENDFPITAGELQNGFCELCDGR
jgi:AcrR family transcriptional regulator